MQGRNAQRIAIGRRCFQQGEQGVNGAQVFGQLLRCFGCSACAEQQMRRFFGALQQHADIANSNGLGGRGVALHQGVFECVHLFLRGAGICVRAACSRNEGLQCFLLGNNGFNGGREAAAQVLLDDGYAVAAGITQLGQAAVDVGVAFLDFGKCRAIAGHGGVCAAREPGCIELQGAGSRELASGHAALHEGVDAQPDGKQQKQQCQAGQGAPVRSGWLGAQQRNGNAFCYGFVPVSFEVLLLIQLGRRRVGYGLVFIAEDFVASVGQRCSDDRIGGVFGQKQLLRVIVLGVFFHDEQYLVSSAAQCARACSAGVKRAAMSRNCGFLASACRLISCQARPS